MIYIDNRQEKVEKVLENSFGEVPLKKNQKLRVEENYLDTVQLLIDTVINLKSKNIIDEIKAN